MISVNSAPLDLSALQALARTFEASESFYTRPGGGYQEAEARSEFIDPLLDALGWDTANRLGLTAASREVLREESQKREDSAAKKPDYTLRYLGQRMLYIEAKKPSVDVLTNMAAIHQARAYGYTDSHPIVVLTNFRDISIYDTSVPARQDDLPDVCRIFTCHYSDFAAKQDELVKLLSRAAVVKESWADQFTSTRPGAIPADQSFIEQINAWRLQIGADIVARHPEVTPELLNDVVQKLINRLVFVRMCEDRGIEGEAILRKATDGSAADLEALFKALHHRYNTGLFDQTITQAEPTLIISSDLLAEIVNRLYAPYSPFSFAVLDADFLGLVYETSLTEHLVIADGATKSVALSKKLEYRQRDVVTTPQGLVDATVARTWQKAAPDFSTNPKVLDFAAGSGRFLVSAFNYYLNLLTEHLVEEKSPRLIQVAAGDFRLPFAEKCTLLKENFFGIDVDYNAVEIARFSLLVRLLEDESFASLPKGPKILPDLDQNIVHGNTLVRSLPKATSGQVALAAPLNLVSTVLPPYFDVIVGNPPYMKTEEMKRFNPAEYNYLKENYGLLHQQFDKYIAFLEFALQHLTPSGVAGVVVPNKWMTIVAGLKLRKEFRDKNLVASLANFRHVQVFADKSIYVCSLILTAEGTDTLDYSEPVSFDDFVTGAAAHRAITAADLPADSSAAWVLPANDYEKRVLDSLATNSLRLKDVVEARNGIQTSKNKVYIIEDGTLSQGLLTFTKNGTSWTIEEAACRPYLEDSRLVRTNQSVIANAHVVFPYREKPTAKQPFGYELIPETEMLVQFPMAYAYLVSNAAGISGRDMNGGGNGEFYAYGRSQAIGYATTAPKILYSVNQRGDKYGFDEVGIAYSSGGTAGEAALFPLQAGYSLEFVMALLSQAPIEFFLRKRGSPFRGGYYARGTDVIGDVPVPRLDFQNTSDVDFHNQVSDLNRRLRKLHLQAGTLAPQQQAVNEEQIRSIRGRLTASFAARWGLDSAEYVRLGLPSV
jgi:hypothetical protein